MAAEAKEYCKTHWSDKVIKTQVQSVRKEADLGKHPDPVEGAGGGGFMNTSSPFALLAGWWDNLSNAI